MDIEDNLDALLELEQEQQEQNEIYEDEIEYIEQQYNTNTPSTSKELISEVNPIDPELIDILNETVEINELENELEKNSLLEEEVVEQYIFTVPPEGNSVLCKLGDGSMVFLKRSTNWKQGNIFSQHIHLLSKPIEELIDEVRENAIRKENIRRELEDYSSKRCQQANWESSFQPRSFIHLLSDEYCNRVFMKWLSQWKPMLFHTHENISTTEIDSLPFFCPTCGKGGFHAKTCTNKQSLRPYFSPDLPSPLPTRPANPLFVLYGPTGCGKTTLIQIAAAAHNLRLLSFGGEMMGVSLEQTLNEIKSCFDNKGLSFGSKNPPLLLFDNFDTAFSAHERKAIVSTLLKKYKEVGTDSSKLLFPVVFCCSDLYAASIYELRSYSQQLKLPQIADNQQMQLLQRICTKQGIPYETSGLSALVASSAGDVRFTLNALHSLVLSTGEVTAKVVKQTLLSSKDVIQSIFDYYSLIFLSPRTQGKSKTTISNNTSIFTHFFDVNQDRLIDGILEYMPTIPLPDPTLQRYSTGLEALIQFDMISKQMKSMKNYSLQHILPTYLCVIHSLYRREKPAKLKHVSTKASYSVYQRVQANQSQLMALKNSKTLRASEGCRTSPLVLEYLSPLLQQITPTIRPVDSLLLTSKEKQELTRITQTMIEYGLFYESSQSTGRLAIALKPDLEAFVIYPEIPSAFSKVSNTVKFKIQAELQKQLLRGEPVSKQHVEQGKETPKKRPASTFFESPKKHPASTFLESPKKKLQMDVTVNEQELEKKMTPIKKSSFFNSQQTSRNRKVVKGVVFRYQQGFTCAVRQPATIHDFL